MQKLSIILISALIALVACTKSKEVHPEIGDGNDEIVTVGMTDVHVEYTRTDHVELQKVIFHYCLAETQQFEAAEMAKRETFFELTLNDLLSDTLYCYYYELFPINGNASNTPQKTFHTQAFESPEPPEPPTPPNGVPEGAINGLFTINANGDQVYFSQGNLQYQASTNNWRFAENQWNYVGGTGYSGYHYGNVNGSSNDNISQTYEGWIDLFGFGTSGYNHGAICYQPWSIDQTWSNYFIYDNAMMNLYDGDGKADWGYNSIINGGNQEKYGWRTLTREEWYYVFEQRNTLSGKHYAKAIVNDTYGMILLPDNWSANINLNEVDIFDADYYHNTFDNLQWSVMEDSGAVFLPITGYRWGTILQDEYRGYYWSSNIFMFMGDTDGTSAYAICFSDWDCSCSCVAYRYYGHSVRLVHDAQ